MTQKKSGGLPEQPAALFPKARAASVPRRARDKKAALKTLEEEAEADFHLTGGIGEVGVGVGNGAEGCIKVQAGQCPSRGVRSSRARRGAISGNNVTRVV